jgi:GAF domain-containing protein
VVDDAEVDPRVTLADRAAYEKTQIRAVICVPLHKAGRFVAAMAVH